MGQNPPGVTFPHCLKSKWNPKRRGLLGFNVVCSKRWPMGNRGWGGTGCFFGFGGLNLNPILPPPLGGKRLVLWFWFPKRWWGKKKKKKGVHPFVILGKGAKFGIFFLYPCQKVAPIWVPPKILFPTENQPGWFNQVVPKENDLTPKCCLPQMCGLCWWFNKIFCWCCLDKKAKLTLKGPPKSLCFKF